MKIVFMGNPEFAVSSLDSLVKSDHQISAVVTNPAKPTGRGRKLIKSPVFEFANSLGLKIIEVDDLYDNYAVEQLTELNADIFVIVASRILPEQIINIPQKGCINLHGSMLPKYRGAAPIQWSLINGDSETGLSTFLIEPKVDTGQILLQKTITIDEHDDYGSLSQRMSSLGGELLVKTLDSFEKHEITPLMQNENLVTHAPKISSNIWNIDWSKFAVEIHNLIRGLSPVPGARTRLNNRSLKIFKTEIIKGSSDLPVGTVITGDGLIIQTGSGLLKVLELQIEGKKRMSISEFLRGNSLSTNTILG